MARIVLFGATGYTGRLTADALARRGARPVLAARSEGKVRALAEQLGGLEHAVADVERPESIRALVSSGDVLVSTVGPFLRWGAPAVEAALAAGAHYIDSTGEPPFIRRVFEEWGPRALTARCALLTAMGYDFVPGNLAAALALRRAAGAPRVRVGYFFTGGGSLRGAASGGTIASLAGVMLERGFAWRGGRLRDERGAARVYTFAGRDEKLTGVSVAGSEHLSLPRLHPELRDVEVYLGWFGPAARPMQAFSAAGDAAMRIPGLKAGADRLVGRLAKGSTGGPDAEARSRSGSLVVAEAIDVAGDVLARVELRGPNGYSYTSDMLAWAAEHAAAGDIRGTGALGPVEAFGLDELRDANGSIGCAEVEAR
jgi:short subunit dehydrogenase-like uncharacterized protein